MTLIKSTRRLPSGASIAALWVTGLACGLRLFHLGAQGLFLDEAWSWAAARFSPAGIIQQTLVDFHPPLYYFILKGWLAFFPAAPAGLRGLSVLFSIACLGVVIIYAQRWYGGPAGILAGWWLALSSFEIYYAQETRMYTLLSLFFILAYVLLFDALRGRSAVWLAWGAVLFLMSWTHFYGLLFAGVHLAFVGGVWLAGRWAKGLPGLPKPARAAALLATAGMLPSAWQLFASMDGNAGGAWVPSAANLLHLYTLMGSGAASIHHLFLDGTHLVLAGFLGVPLWLWFLISTLFWGWFVFLGLRRAWLQSRLDRLQALAALLFLALPVCLAALGGLTGRQLWAFKPFLGLACLTYFWAGVGLAGVRPALRVTVAAGVLLTSSITLIPYYSVWQKTDANLAFSSMIRTERTDAIVLEHFYEAPVVFYYRQDEAEVWGLSDQPDGSQAWVKVQYPGIRPADSRLATCEDARLRQISRVWFYGSPGSIRVQQLPACLQGVQFYHFQPQGWMPISP